MTTAREEVAVGATVRDRPVEFEYVNWRDERSVRRVLPLRLYHGSCDWHPEKQWLLDGIDLDRHAFRTFAANGIVSISEESRAVLRGVPGWEEFEAESR